jgi:hypothetical protein
MAIHIPVETVEARYRALPDCFGETMTLAVCKLFIVYMVTV